MSPSRDVFELFDAAAREAPGDLRTWLQERAATPEIARKVEELLEADRAAARDDRFLESPIRRNDTAFELPSIEGYTIDRLIGTGGMGEVYEARQHRPDRRVAIKVIRTDVHADAARVRFEHESEILARLNHPCIARVHAAGVTTRGLREHPWFAMEFIDGIPLDEWTLRHRPNLTTTLKMLARIADAVHHAHQKGILHRDIKPANVLVTPDQEPKLLEFGVARTLDAAQRPTGIETLPGRIIGTIAYMSPEQIGGEPDRIDARSDVYALGVVAYRMLTGRLPHATESSSLVAAARAIQEDPPTPPGRLAHALRGDIETVLMTALAKDPDRRYPSASEFAADLRRVIDRSPITARPPSAAYQFRCFARRHRPLVITASAALCIMIAATIGISVLAWKLARTAEERDQRRVIAERETARASAVTRFLERTLTASDPLSQWGDAPEITVSELLDRSEAWLEETFDDAPQSEADARRIIASSYRSLGRYEEAERHVRRSLELSVHDEAASFSESERRMRATLLTEHALLLSYLDQSEAAGVRLTEALDAIEMLPAELDESTPVRYANAGFVLRRLGMAEEAESMLRRALHSAEAIGPTADLHRALAMGTLAGLRATLGDSDDARTLLNEARAIVLQRYGDEHPHVAVIDNNLGHLAFSSNDHREAQRHFRSAAERLERRLGIHHPRTLTTLNNLASAEHALGDFESADNTFRRTLNGLTQVFGQDHREYRSTLRNYAWMLSDAERYGESGPAWAEVARRFAEGSEGERPLATLYAVYAAGDDLLADPANQDRVDRLRAAFVRQLDGAPAGDPATESARRATMGAFRTTGREEDALWAEVLGSSGTSP